MIYEVRDVGHSLLHALDMTFGDFGILDELIMGNRVMGPLVFFVYAVFVPIVLMNLFIAVLSNTYSDLDPLNQQVWEIQTTRLLQKSIASSGKVTTFDRIMYRWIWIFKYIRRFQKKQKKTEVEDVNLLNFSEQPHEVDEVAISEELLGDNSKHHEDSSLRAEKSIVVEDPLDDYSINQLMLDLQDKRNNKSTTDLFDELQNQRKDISKTEKAVENMRKDLSKMIKEEIHKAKIEQQESHLKTQVHVKQIEDSFKSELEQIRNDVSQILQRIKK